MAVSQLRWWCLSKTRPSFSRFHHGNNFGWAKPAQSQCLLLWGMVSCWSLSSGDLGKEGASWWAEPQHLILNGKNTCYSLCWEQGTQVIPSFPATVQCLGFTPWAGRAQPLFSATLCNLQSQNIWELNWCCEPGIKEHTGEASLCSNNSNHRHGIFVASNNSTVLLKMKVCQSYFAWVDSNGWYFSPLTLVIFL